LCDFANTDYVTMVTVFSDDVIIQGVNVKEELVGLISELPAVYTKVIELLATVQPAITYYKSFVEFSCGRWVEFNCLLML